MRLYTIPVRAKLVDEEATKKLMARVEELKRTMRPEQGWLDAPENAVNRLPKEKYNA